MKSLKKSFKTLGLLFVFVSFLTSQIAYAGVIVSTSGTSNGVPVVGRNGPKGINQTASLSKHGGSIRRAKAKAKFTSQHIDLGNQVISKSTPGDPKLTHVDANSTFAGIATFTSDDGNPVDNFTIGLDVHGQLKCKSNAMNTFFSIAQTEVELIVDQTSKFSGFGTQDGTGPFFDSGDLAGQFQMGANTATINKQFPINLGTLQDGQKLPFFFSGTTLVSFGEMIGITFCQADFLMTSSFEPLPGQKGMIDITPGKEVSVVYIDDDPKTISGSEKLLIESSDSSIINNIKPGSVKVIFLGNVTYSVDAGPPGDVNINEITDSVLTSQSTTLASTIAAQGVNTLIVYGQTTTGDVFYGLLDVSKLK